MDFDVTAVPQDLIVELGLSRGVRYAIQNIDSSGRVFARVQATAPVAGDRGFIIPPLAYSYPQADGGEGIWVWSPDASGSTIFVTPS